MLISPPFLTDKIKESDILDSGLQLVMAREATTLAPEGNFPVSQSFIWHTGIHLQAPKLDAVDAPVRAIANGKVVFVNPPRPKVDNADDGQAYNPYGTAASWTDNGMIIIEHTRDIGADGDTATAVVFYSCYMHLSFIEAAAAVGKKVFRKDVIGKPGVIYGHAGQIELSISCDDANLQKLIGRKPEWLEPQTAPAKDGRTDTIFGNMYIYLPASTPIKTADPMPTAHVQRLYGNRGLGCAAMGGN